MIPLPPVGDDTEAPTEAPTEDLAELHTEALTEASTEALTQAPLDAPAEARPEVSTETLPPRVRRAIPFNTIALALAVGFLIAQFVAINLASTGSPVAATVIAQTLIWLTAVPFLIGAVALVRGPHRGWAITAMIVSVIANPFILRNILLFFGSL